MSDSFHERVAPMMSTPVSTTAQLARERRERHRVGAHTQDLIVKAVVAEDATTVSVDDGQQIITGRSWKSRKDDPDPDVGYYLALGRALEAMGRDLQREAWRRVHNKESK